MVSGRNPASISALPFDGDTITSGSQIASTSANGSDYSSILQVKNGNRCGHNKNIPLFHLPPPEHKNRPKILRIAKQRLNNLYFHPLADLAGKISFNSDKINKRGGFRKVRSEMRNLVNNCIGDCLLHYLDLKTMYVGFTNDKGRFIYFGVSFISKTIIKNLRAQKTIETITYERVRKAIKAFEAAGYLHIETSKTVLPNGQYRSLPSRIRVNRVLFSDLGIDESLIKESLDRDEKKLNSGKAEDPFKRI